MPTDGAAPHLGWNPLSDLSQVLEYHFMVNALLAGGIVALMSGAIGWLMVVRRETFAGHTLSMMAFPGAAAAALAGVPAGLGYLAFCGAGALAIGAAGEQARGSWRQESARIGSVQALALGAGFLFVSLYGGVLSDLETLLFGNPLAVSDAQVLVLAAVAAGAAVALALAGRPLLFASVDPAVAAARGVPVRGLGIAFLLLLAAAVAATSQITGPLLVFALLVVPAAAAQVLTARPVLSLALTLLFGLAVVWLGLAVSYFSPYPASFWISAIAFALYVSARVAAGLRGRGAERPEPEAVPEGVIA